jgi:putative ABC transport system permease protein
VAATCPYRSVSIEKTWKKYLPEVPIDNTFLDARIDKLYIADQQQRTIFTIFSCIAIFIACLGLTWAVSIYHFTACKGNWYQEKCFGASLNNIVSLLSRIFSSW